VRPDVASIQLERGCVCG